MSIWYLKATICGIGMAIGIITNNSGAAIGWFVASVYAIIHAIRDKYGN